MANALMATGLQMPQIDTMGSFAQGVNARQTTENNQLTIARKGMENIGAIALGAMGGKMDGPVNPEQFEQGLDMLAEQGLNVEAFRGRPEIAPIAARASLTALQQLQVAQNEREMELALQKFQHDLAQAASGGGASFSQTPVFLVDDQGRQHAAQMSSAGGLFINGETLPGIPEGWKVVARPDNLTVKDTGDALQVFDPNSGTFTPGPTIQGAPSANLDVQVNPGGGRTMAPAAGSPQALEAQAAEEAATVKEEAAATKADIVIQDADRALEKIKADPFWTSGLMGSWLSNIGGTPAADVKRLIDTVRANAGFAELQSMRDSSPTGGALGQVTERELQFLQSVIGSLEQDQGSQQLVQNLERVKEAFLDIIHGKGNRPGEGAGSSGGAGLPNPADMTDEELLEMLVN